MGKLDKKGSRAAEEKRQDERSAPMKRRVLMTLAGVTVSGFSVGFFTISNLGYDPFQLFAHGVWLAGNKASGVNIAYGTYYMLICLALLLVFAFLNRKLLGLGTVFNLFLSGYVADFSTFLFQKVFPAPGAFTRLLLLLAGIVIMCFASALYFTANLGVSAYDAVALTISEKNKKVPFRWWRIGCDLICVLIGVWFGAPAGLGTIITAFFMGPLIDFFRRTVSEPLLYSASRSRKEK